MIVKSSNVGAIKVGLKLGAERMGLYVSRFGFGRRSSPDFPGESPGIVWEPSKLNDSALASVSMGYQVGVTPLQMAAAVSVDRQRRHALSSRTSCARSSRAARARVVEPKAVRRAILPETAATLTEIMEEVVDRRHRQSARSWSATTSRARPAPPTSSSTAATRTSQQNVSFVGFVPSRNPALTVIVMIDSPRVGGDTGGAIAAPIFKRIAEASAAPARRPADDQSRRRR